MLDILEIDMSIYWNFVAWSTRENEHVVDRPFCHNIIRLRSILL